MVTLAYWYTRALAEPIRMILHYSNIQFQDKHYTVGPPPDYDKSGYNNQKFTLGLDFPNLPYFINQQIKLTETIAIIHYIVAKYNPDLDGETIEEKALIQMVGSVANDIKDALM